MRDEFANLQSAQNMEMCMKKFVGLIFALFCAFSVFAASPVSEFSCISYPVGAAYRNKDGLILKVAVDSIGYKQMYVPQRWFEFVKDSEEGRKAELRLSSKNSPHVTIYYKNGEFYLARVYMPKNQAHPSWRIAPFGMDFSSKFESDELLIE